MKINPGELNKPINIIRESTNAGYDEDTGMPAPMEDVVLRKPFAKITNLSGKEVIANKSITEEVTTKFLLRASTLAITSDMVIKYKNNKYDISYINEINEDSMYLEILAVRRS